MDPNDRDSSHAPDANNRKYVWVVAHVWDLPYGRGLSWGSNAKGWGQAVLGGWVFNGITSVMSGLPVFISWSDTSSLDNGGNFGQRPNLVGDPMQNIPAGHWYNPAAFANPALYQFGNNDSGSIVGPNFISANWSLWKEFRFKTFLAIEEYRRALALDPRAAGLHFELGEMLLASSNTEEARSEAEKEFRADLTLNPTNASSEYMLGEIEWQRSRPEEALKHDMRALQLREGYVDADIAAGKALTALNRPQEALPYLQAAVTLDPQNEVAHYRLARACQKLGRTDEAARQFALFKQLQDAHRRFKSYTETYCAGP